MDEALLQCASICSADRVTGLLGLQVDFVRELGNDITSEKSTDIKMVLIERLDLSSDLLSKLIMEEAEVRIRVKCVQKYRIDTEADFIFICALMNDVSELVRLESLKLMQCFQPPTTSTKIQLIEKTVSVNGFDLDTAGALILGLEDEWEAVRLESLNVIASFAQADIEFQSKASEVVLYCIGDESERVRRMCLKMLVGWQWSINMEVEVADFLLPLVLDSIECVRDMVLQLISLSVIEHATVLVRILRTLGKYVIAYPLEESRVYQLLRHVSKGTLDLVLEVIPTLLRVERFMVPQEQRIEEPMYRVVAFMLLVSGMSDPRVWECLPKYLREKHINYFLPYLVGYSDAFGDEGEIMRRLQTIHGEEYLKSNIEFYLKVMPKSCRLRHLRAVVHGEDTNRFWEDHSRCISASILQQRSTSEGILVSVELDDFPSYLKTEECIHLLVLDGSFNMLKACPLDTIVQVDDFGYYVSFILEPINTTTEYDVLWIGVGLCEQDKYVTLSDDLVRLTF